MDCHFKKGDVILLSDEEAVKKVSDPNCLIEEGVVFRFYYEEQTTENTQKSIEQIKNKTIKKEVIKKATTSKESIKMPEVPVDVSEQQSLPEEVETQAVSSIPSEVPFDVNQILTTTGGGGGVAIVLAIVAILGGGAAWKFYQKYSEQKHEQEMKKLELQAQSQGLNGAQPPPCQAANAALEAKLAALETKFASIEKKTSSFSAGFDAEEIEDKLIKLEKKVKSLSART